MARIAIFLKPSAEKTSLMTLQRATRMSLAAMKAAVADDRSVIIIETDNIDHYETSEQLRELDDQIGADLEYVEVFTDGATSVRRGEKDTEPIDATTMRNILKLGDF